MPEKMLTRRQALIATAGMATAAAAAVAATPAFAEFQPMMQAALNSLSTARAQLMNGTSDKGGHRLAAVALVDQAITQVQLGISWDDTH
jgi:hypothetical protein